MATKPFAAAIIGADASPGDFIANILHASTEHSITGKSLSGTILPWNECAWRMYGYEPTEVIGKANAEILHAPEDIALGKPGEICLQDHFMFRQEAVRVARNPNSDVFDHGARCPQHWCRLDPTHDPSLFTYPPKAMPERPRR